MTELDYRPEVFVRARLDEDEKAERRYGEEGCDLCGHTPRRPLADIAAKRRILDLIQPDLDTGTQVFAPDRDGFERWSKAYLTACALAAPYEDHPDYSHKWAHGPAALPQKEKP